LKMFSLFLISAFFDFSDVFAGMCLVMFLQDYTETGNIFGRKVAFSEKSRSSV